MIIRNSGINQTHRSNNYIFTNYSSQLKFLADVTDNAVISLVFIGDAPNPETANSEEVINTVNALFELMESGDIRETTDILLVRINYK